MKKRSSLWRGSRERDRRRWRRRHADGRELCWESEVTMEPGCESTEPGGGSARPSPGAGVADFQLISLPRDVALWMATARTELAFVTPLVVVCCHKTCDCSKT